MYGEDEYLESHVMTASPHQLHLMVVDGAIRHAVQGIEALEQNDVEAAHFALNNSRGFVGELISGLDDSQSPELVEKLKGLFFYVFRCLVDADLNRDVRLARDALKILNLHRETWLAVVESLPADARKNAPPEPHNPQPGEPEEHRDRSWTS